MPMHNSDTRLEHIDCLSKLGWLAFDVTHMGEPDGYLLGPCCQHGYRAVYSPRPKVEWARALTSDTADGSPGSGSGTLENTWNWTDPTGGDQSSFFTQEQTQGGEGSWVLIAGATQDGDGPPIDAQAKWWMTTQNDADSIEEELVNPALNADGSLVAAGDYLGRSVRWRHESHWHTQGGSVPGLRRWVKNEDPVTGSGGLNNTGGGGNPGGISDFGLGIEDPGLGSESGLPGLAGFGKYSGTDYAASTIWWIKYGNRKFLGINNCVDPIGANQERDDHAGHGHGSNWRGMGLTDSFVNDMIHPQASARGGYVPNIQFFGGDVKGASGHAICDSSTGDITGISITDPGATVVTHAMNDNHTAPLVNVSMPFHYRGFDATATVSTDPQEILAALPGLFKTKLEMEAELCDGYTDPIAQTFLVSGRSFPDGVFVPSIDLCFSSKPAWGTGDPVTLEIRPTINGYPSSDLVESSKELTVEQVKVSPGVDYDEMPLATWENPRIHDAGGSQSLRADYPSFDNVLSYTTFTFKYPVYLESGKEYAIVVHSNNSDYKCWISDTRSEVVLKGQSLSEYDNEGYAKVTAVQKKQYGGSFFRSQNGRTWSADQHEDLMFRVNRCDFNGSVISPETGTTSLSATHLTENDFLYDRINLNLNSFKSPGSDTSMTAVLKTQKESLAEGTLTEVDGLSGKIFTESFDQSTKNLSERMKVYKNKSLAGSSIELGLTLSTKNPHVSPIYHTRNMYAMLHKNIINSGGLVAKDIKISETGLNYVENDAFKVTGGGSTTDATFIIPAAGKDTDGRIIGIEMVSSGSNFHKKESLDGSDPIVITKTTSSVGTGAVFEVVSEESQDGGNGSARYVTKTINLAPGMSARALKVFFTAKQPYQSNIYVYFKALAEEDDEPIGQKKWKLMNRTSPDEDTFFETSSSFDTVSGGGYFEHEYDTDEYISYIRADGQTYDSFKSFAIKVVLMAENPARPPEVKDFRAIAVF